MVSSGLWQQKRVVRAGSKEVRSSSTSAWEVGARGELQEPSQELTERESVGMGWVSTCSCSSLASSPTKVQKAPWLPGRVIWTFKAMIYSSPCLLEVF